MGDANQIVHYCNVGKYATGTLIDGGKGAYFHEALHLLGLSDRYNTDGGTNARTWSGWKGDVMGDPNSYNFSQTHYDNYGRQYAGADGTFVLKTAVDVDSSTGAPIGDTKNGLTGEEKKQVSLRK